LERNYSLPAADVDALLQSHINFTEVYTLLFGSIDTDTNSPSRSKRSSPFQNPAAPFAAAAAADPFAQIMNSSTSSSTNPTNTNAKKALVDTFSSILSPKSALRTAMDLPHPINKIVSKFQPEPNPITPFSTPNNDATMTKQEPFVTGLIYRTLRNNPSLLKDPEVLDVVAKLTGFEPSSEVDPVEMVDVLTKVFLTADNLRYMTCTPGEMERVLVPPAGNNTHTLVSGLVSLFHNLSRTHLSFLISNSGYVCVHCSTSDV
jgi:hypothetical protein